MKLNKNSINARVFRFALGKELPTNLCPYFWESILSWIILPFVSLFQLFSVPLRLNKTLREEMGEGTFEARLSGLLLITILFLLTCVGLFIVGLFVRLADIKSGLGMMQFVGGSTLGILMFIAFSILLLKLKKPTIIKEYIKAKKGKYCPQIDWTDEK